MTSVVITIKENPGKKEKEIEVTGWKHLDVTIKKKVLNEMMADIKLGV